MQLDTSDLLDRFLRYVRIDTRSNDQSADTPSTPGQWDLLRLLATELQALGLADVSLTEHGYLLATLPATSPKPVPTIAWFAHVDTAPNLPGLAKPLVHRAYAGQPIVLPDDPTQQLTLDTIDMEAYALAKVCQQQQQRFVCLKFITDGADGQAANDWASAVILAADQLADAIRRCADEHTR